MKFECFLAIRTLSQSPWCLSGRQFEHLVYLCYYFPCETLYFIFPIKKEQVYKGTQLQLLINQHLQMYLMLFKTKPEGPMAIRFLFVCFQSASEKKKSAWHKNQSSILICTKSSFVCSAVQSSSCRKGVGGCCYQLKWKQDRSREEKYLELLHWMLQYLPEQWKYSEGHALGYLSSSTNS